METSRKMSDVGRDYLWEQLEKTDPRTVLFNRETAAEALRRLINAPYEVIVRPQKQNNTFIDHDQLALF